METIRIINFIITAIFALCYTYQFIYVPVSLWMQHREKKARKSAGRADIQADKELCDRNLKSYAVLICARNEENVIGELIDSINSQTYKGNITTFVMADNCTDNTYDVAVSHNAVAYTRHSTEFIGKGYAMEALLKEIRRDFPEGFDGYFVFDADNILSPDYIEEMHKCHLEGNDVITSYRNTKNYGDNWISSGYGLWFLRETMYLNYARYKLGSSAAISGTGFFFANSVLKDIGGWPFHLLTEDIEFTINRVCKGRKIAFCRSAVFYDEQPTSVKQSFRQRMRWARGYIQVFRHYGKDLMYETLHGNFAAFDMAMNIMPAFLLTAISITCNLLYGIIGAVTGGDITIALWSMFETVINACALLFVLGGITMITEWKNIHAGTARKIFSVFSFPLFMLTYIPVAFTALFVNPGWKPIRHKAATSALRTELTGSETGEKIS
ncbi:glycosyltransferase family 2 protein [Butyrivibrio sp. AE2032]|uniref:glycosyltransferase family 2 protein n=1 Tax=Butyrivibrio sp. AE2032 TaxID=1458463 RepID=UPI00068A9CFD|nr:glycosyltransferase family 2 protein [Butyrivibrio sp. AE2032]